MDTKTRKPFVTSVGYSFVDRYGVPLCAGLQVRIQHCVGRYGQTQIISGVLKSIDDYGGCTVGTHYIASVFDPFRKDYGEKVQVGIREHRDFEHSHTSFIEVCAS